MAVGFSMFIFHLVLPSCFHGGQNRRVTLSRDGGQPLPAQPHTQAVTGPNWGTLLASPPRRGALRALQGRQHSPSQTPARSHSFLARPRSPAQTPGHLLHRPAWAWAPHHLLPPPVAGGDAAPMAQQAGGAPCHKGAGTALAPERWPQRPRSPAMAARADGEAAQLPAPASASALDTNSTRGTQLLSPLSSGPHLQWLSAPYSTLSQLNPGTLLAAPCQHWPRQFSTPYRTRKIAPTHTHLGPQQAGW